MITTSISKRDSNFMKKLKEISYSPEIIRWLVDLTLSGRESQGDKCEIMASKNVTLVELNQALSAKMNLYPQAICEKEVTIQLLQDENATLQLEIRTFTMLVEKNE
ncbi:hypothetical protein RhiirA4_458483 [Rhizophagus irregularis]|uniref:Uncharacterized protein n=1 Tax=Rhizophagus irregularis TaxID=588596 RepID=A0A2I1GCA6_9GLOM|nr:hypothetical protein RhiirA4_458483 [Rhizophagus irregularis]